MSFHYVTVKCVVGYSYHHLFSMTSSSAKSMVFFLRVSWAIFALWGAARVRASCPSGDSANRGSGETWDEKIVGVPGVHRFSLPDSYDASSDEPMPLLLYFHGWGESRFGR